MKLDCGHEPTPTMGIGTGYGQTPEGLRLCYDCCAERDREQACKGEPVTAYLSNPPIGETDQRLLVTTWAGIRIGRVFSFSTWNESGAGRGKMYAVRVRIEGCDRVFYGRGQGPGMHINLRPAKGAL